MSDGTGQTDSFGSKSDNSGKTTVTNADIRPRLEIVVVIDLHKKEVSPLCHETLSSVIDIM